MAYVLLVAAAGTVVLLLPALGFARGWPVTVVLAVCGAATAFWFLVVPFWLRERWRVPSRVLAGAVGALVLLATWIALVQIQAQSPWRVLAAMAIVWIADTAAYFTGRAFGRHKLAPAISPGKTWEGVGGALITVALYATIVLLASGTAGDLPGGIGSGVLLAVVVAAISVCGDLFESLLKRQAGVKDSGHVLPGHGGVLDRIDALLAAMPPLALAFALVQR
jgi:phosphatidate cytidylyltransferase